MNSILCDFHQYLTKKIAFPSKINGIIFFQGKAVFLAQIALFLQKYNDSVKLALHKFEKLSLIM
jgi:hypothetical protein